MGITEPHPERNPATERMVSHGYLLWEYVPDEERHYLAGVIDLSCQYDGEEQADTFYKTGKLLQPVIQLPYTGPIPE